LPRKGKGEVCSRCKLWPVLESEGELSREGKKRGGEERLGGGKEKEERGREGRGRQGRGGEEGKRRVHG